MTIKEVETLSGLPRANIRYYESEGLIAPKRAENGYREYSQADIDVLLRVKLLRALGLRIDTIKSLAAGTLTLESALDTRLEELRGTSADACGIFHARRGGLSRRTPCRVPDCAAAGREAVCPCAGAAVHRTQL